MFVVLERPNPPKTFSFYIITSTKQSSYIYEHCNDVEGHMKSTKSKYKHLCFL